MGFELPDYVNENKLEKRLGETGLKMMAKKYLNRDKGGNIIETPAQRVYSISRVVAEVEKNYGKPDEEINGMIKKFYQMISNGEFSPGGRILSNAASDIKALFNCYALPVPDDLDGIYEQVRNAAIIHKKGGGTGYNFSHLRPRGTYVQTSRGVASGPVSFAEQFDKETEIINSGNRRGANMGILNMNHPDIMNFIHAKTTEDKLTNFNISVAVTNKFMEGVVNDEYYTLMFSEKPLTRSSLEKIIQNIETNMGGAEVGSNPSPPSLKIEGNKIFDTYWGEEIGIINEGEEVQLSARKVFNRITKLAHQTADPGIIFLDHINEDNLLPSDGIIETTNPCGEQPLHAYDACNLGSINLSEMIKYDNNEPTINFNKIKNTTQTAVRFLDNCNDLNKGPIKKIEETVRRNRRIGLGVMGWADMLIKLGIPYDSQKALDLAEQVMGTITNEARNYSEFLAEEKGEFPSFKDSTYKTNGEKKIRNVQRTTIAPTGTICMVFGCSSGIEPIYKISYFKNMRGNERIYTLSTLFKEEMKKRKIEVTDDLEQKIIKNKGELGSLKEVPEDLQELFKTAHEIPFEQHVRMQVAFQKHTDNAVSKTINLREDATEEDVRKAYMLAWEGKCKGITIYRDKSKSIQVLETKDLVPEIHFRYVEMPNNNIEVNDNVIQYKIRRGEERMHILISSRLFKGEKENYYLLPHADFQVTKPIGTEMAGEFAQSGIDRTQFLQGPDPDYVEFIKDLKSVRGDRSVGFGPHRIDSPSHAGGLCFEHLLLSQGVVEYNDKKELEQIIRKKDLKEIGFSEARKIIMKWRGSEKIENTTGELHVKANRVSGIQFKCKQCGSTEPPIFKDGCSDPVCSECEWSIGKCD